MMKLSFALLMSLFVLTSACTKNDSVSYDNDAVSVTPIANLDNAEFVYESTESASKDTPSQALNAVTLQNTITLTLERHHGLKVILANLEAAEYSVDSAKAGWTPRVDVLGNYGFDHQSNNIIDGKKESGMHPGGSVSLVVTQSLWDGYATRSRVNAGIATVDSITARVFDNATTFALDAIIAHVDVIRRRQIVALSQSNVASHEKVLASQRMRVENGAAVASDVTYTQGRLLRAYAALAQNIELAQRAESQYHRLTGTYPSLNLEEVVLPEVYSDATVAYEQATLTNPKIQAYLYDVDAAKFNVDLAKSNYHPQIDLEAGVSYSDRDAGDSTSNYQESFDTRVL